MKDVKGLFQGPVTAKTAIPALLRLLPELQSEYEEDLKIFGAEFSTRFHSVYGQLLNPYLMSSLQDNNWGENQKLREIFDFIELLSNSDDPEAQELVAVTICERLGDDREVLRRARELMGFTTLRLSREIEIGWGREE